MTYVVPNNRTEDVVSIHKLFEIFNDNSSDIVVSDKNTMIRKKIDEIVTKWKKETTFPEYSNSVK